MQAILRRKSVIMWLMQAVYNHVAASDNLLLKMSLCGCNVIITLTMNLNM